MAKSLGEVNYEYLIAVFGAVEGHEDFFTSDDGQEVLVIPQGLHADAPAEAGTGALGTVSARIDSAEAPTRIASAKAPTRSRAYASRPGGTGVFARLFDGIVAAGRTLRRLMRRGAAL
jgi:hypothetical protein